MSHLSLSLLGGFEARLDGEALTAFGADKARALLAFLAIEAARPHRRAELGGLLWPDLPEKKAAHNLSQTLLRLRTALREPKTPANSDSQTFLLLTPQDVQLNPLASYRLDVAVFSQLLQAYRQHRHSADGICPICSQWLAQAVDLYRGDLLAGFFVNDSAGFEEWRLARQEVLHQQAVEALARLVAYHEQRGEYDRVQDYARRMIKLEPWKDQPHLQLMQALNHTGQPAAALEQYETYRRTLTEELGLEPSAEATVLYEQIKTAESEKTGSGEARPLDRFSQRSPGERRQVTVLICGQARTTVSRDPEELRERLSVCRRHCENIVNQLGGYRLRRQGHECVILFGYPQALEDAPRRAVDAGLAMTQAASGARNDAVCVGIHTGLMVEGERHRSHLADPEFFSEAPNVARACQDLADPGAVFITAETERLVYGLFDCEPVGLTAQRLAIYRARGESGLASRLDWLAQTRHLTSFVGRQSELDRLTQAWNKAQRGQGQSVLISGAPGLGKSRLLLEFKNALLHANKDRPSGSLWLESRCSPYFHDTSLHPIIDLIEQLLDWQAADSTDIKRDKLINTLARFDLARPATVWLLSLLLDLPTDTPPPETITAEQRARMREVFVALVQKRAAQEPLLLVIEDLHWSDPSTVEWLGQSLAALGAVPCLILLTARPSFIPTWPPHAQLLSLTLGPLSPIETRQLLSELASDQPLRDEVRQRIITQTDGIPLFIEELTRTVIESNYQTSQVSPEIPATLRDSLMARLDHVGAAKETAHWAAVLGREFSYSVLQAVVPFDEAHLQHDLVRLMEADLIYRLEQTTTFYSFKHALIQDMAYASLLKRTRQDYHRQIAEMLETRFPQTAETQPEILAQHYASAGLHLQAVDYWLRAGEQAIAHGATLEAKAFFDRAIEGSEPVDTERRWQALAGRERVFDLRVEREAQQRDITALRELAEASDNDTWRAQAWLHQMIYDLHCNHFLAACRAADAARETASRVGNRALVVRALAGKVHALIDVEDRAAALQAAEETLAELQGVGDNAAQAYALSEVALYFHNVGDLSRAVLLLQQAAQAAGREGNRYRESTIHVNLGATYSQLGLFPQARDTFEEGLALAEALGERGLPVAFRGNLSYVYWSLGDRDRAIALGERALRENKIMGGSPYYQAAILAGQGLYLESAGEWAAAVEYITEARAMFASLGMNSEGLEPQVAEARARLALGQQEEARQLASDAWEYLHKHGSAGIFYPARVYRCVADVADAIKIPRFSAQEVIEAGYHDLMQRAEKISDPEWRRSFLENVTENRAVVERWRTDHADLNARSDASHHLHLRSGQPIDSDQWLVVT